MERDTAPKYYQNKDYNEEISYIRVEVKSFKGYHYNSPYQKQVIEDNIASNITSELPVPLFSNCVNLAGSAVPRKQALENIVKHTEEQGLPIQFSYAAGFKLITKEKNARHQWKTHSGKGGETKDFWLPYGSWQQLPSTTRESFPDSDYDFIGYNPNTNWLPYNNWFNSVHFNLSQKVTPPISRHILSFWIWRRIPKKGTSPLHTRTPPLLSYIGSSESKPKIKSPVVNQNSDNKTSEQRSWAELGEPNPWFDYHSRKRKITNKRHIPTTVNPQGPLNPVHQN